MIVSSHPWKCLSLALLLVIPLSTHGFSPTITPTMSLNCNPPSDELVRYRARAAYDGNGFQGFQLQPDRRTIQGDLEQVLSQRFQRQVRVVGAGRTDAGVHARGQAIHFDLQKGDIQSPEALKTLEYSMNRMLRQDLQVYNLQEAPLVTKKVNGIVGPFPWHAIYDATGKLYIYRISAAKSMDPLERHTRYDLSWRPNLDLDLLQRTLKHCEGTHDFRAFAVGIDEKESFLDGTVNTRRTVYSVDMIDEGAGMFRIEVRLKGALYKMIRNIMGTALDVAWGITSEEKFLALLHGGASRRENKSKPAPPQGLMLEQVYYDDY